MEASMGRRAWRSGRVLLVTVLMGALVVAPYIGAANATWDSMLDTERVSVDSDGEEGGRKGSRAPAVSMDGRYVAFMTGNGLAPGDDNSDNDVYLRDTMMGTTTRVSVNKDGESPDSDSKHPAISGDGRYVAFESNATDHEDTNTDSSYDVFVRDMETGTTTLVSINTAGDASGNNQSRSPAFSGDGKYIIFQSTATDIHPDDADSGWDVFRYDMDSGTVDELVSIDKDGVAGAGGCESGGDEEQPSSICMSGRYVAFQSSATDLVENDTNGHTDVFLRDIDDGTTTRVSVATDGTQADKNCEDPSVSSGGLYVVFESTATNLSTDDEDEDDDGDKDIFVRDTTNDETMLVTKAPEGAGSQRGANLFSERSLSYDGKYLAFSTGMKLAPEDTNGALDFYVADLMTGEFMVVKDGATASGWARPPESESNALMAELSGDGHTIAFGSVDGDIVPDDYNFWIPWEGYGRGRDVFKKDLTPRLPEGGIRWAGATRYDTAVAVSEGTFPDGADAVVIATGENWPDALCGSALAGAVDGPILLTTAASIPGTVKNEILRLGAQNAYILGGTGVVSAEVEAELEGLVSGSVKRLSGANRYMTSQAIATQVAAIYGSAWDGGVIVTTGENFADALAGAPLAAGIGWPVLLASPTAGTVFMPPGMEEAVILGGTGAVPATVETALEGSADEVTRVGGATRYETAAMTAEYGVDNGLLWNGTGLATGENFPDGLTGGASAGLNRTVLLLTPTASLAPAAATALDDNKDDIMTVQFFGGPGAVSEAVENQVKSILGM